MNGAPLIRVSRKRSADPHEALILQIKKVKAVEPVVFTLYKTKNSIINETEEEAQLDGVQIVELAQNAPEVKENEDGEGSSSKAEQKVENPLDFVNDEAIGQIGEVEKLAKKVEDEVILNGQKMVKVDEKPGDDEIVFDYYRIHGGGNPQNLSIYSNRFKESNTVNEENFEFRFANNEEAAMFYYDNDSEDEIRPDDDDDSNDEGNWRNDYPDEDSYDEDCDDDDDEGPYGELVAQPYHRGENLFPDESFQRRFQNFAINDRYEAYFEGDETDGEEE